MMKVTYDEKVDAAYIYLKKIPPGGAATTYVCDRRRTGGHIALDFDKDGVLLGIEVLNASKKLPKGILPKKRKGKHADA